MNEYDELLLVFAGAYEPLNFAKVLAKLPDTTDLNELEHSLDVMVRLGMLDEQTDPDLGFPHLAWSVSELYR